MRGKVTGPEFAATARLLPPEEFARARQTIDRKYLDGAADFAFFESGRFCRDQLCLEAECQAEQNVSKRDMKGGDYSEPCNCRLKH
jgi:hypothetical protein